MSKKRIRPPEDASPVWSLDSGHDGLLEIYAVAGRLELRCDLWHVTDDEDTEDGLARLKAEAAEYAERNRE